MTIAVGFKCIDGVVLAADSQYTEGISKLTGQKIFPIPSNGYYALTIAGAGGVHSLKGIVREIRKGLAANIGANAVTISDTGETARLLHRGHGEKVCSVLWRPDLRTCSP